LGFFQCKAIDYAALLSRFLFETKHRRKNSSARTGRPGAGAKKWLQRGLQLLVRRLKRFASLWKAKHTLNANTHVEVIWMCLSEHVWVPRISGGVGGRRSGVGGRAYCKTNGKLLFDVVSQLCLAGCLLPSSTTMTMMGMEMENGKWEIGSGKRTSDEDQC